jgi:hypothetical protein
VAIPIALGTPRTGTLPANEVVFFKINPTIDGRLIAQLHAPGGTTRLALLNMQGQTLLTSDGQSLANPDDLIDIDVAAGTDYLEFENLGSAVSYALTTTLEPASPPFQPIASGSGPDAIVAGDFTGDGRTDLAVANAGSLDSNDNLIPGTGTVSVLLGNGDGTFQPAGSYAVGSDPDAIVAGNFTGDGHIDLAVANEGSLDSNSNPIAGRVCK